MRALCEQSAAAARAGAPLRAVRFRAHRGSRSTSASPVTSVPAPDLAPGRARPDRRRGCRAGRPPVTRPAPWTCCRRGRSPWEPGSWSSAPAYYAHLAVAGHSLPPAGMAALSVLWSIVFLLGLGVFLPDRAGADPARGGAHRGGRGHRPGGPPRLPAVGDRARRHPASPLAAAAGPLAGLLFGGDTAMVAVLGGACVRAGGHRGEPRHAGRPGRVRRLRPPARHRRRPAGGCWPARSAWRASHSAVAFGLILTVAPLLAVVATLGPLLAEPAPRARAAGWRR